MTLFAVACAVLGASHRTADGDPLRQRILQFFAMTAK
jgi:hypothetical protein